MPEIELPDRVRKKWEEWSKKHPRPLFENNYYNDRKLEFLERMKRDLEKLPDKTKAEEASMRRLEREAQRLRKMAYPGTVERLFSELRNPVARFIAQFLRTMREMGNKRREVIGMSSDDLKTDKRPKVPQQQPSGKETPKRPIPGYGKRTDELRAPGKDEAGQAKNESEGKGIGKDRARQEKTLNNGIDHNKRSMQRGSDSVAERSNMQSYRPRR